MLNRRSVLLAGLAMPALARPGFAADPIKIGMTQPLTGAVAASGNYVANGAKIADRGAEPRRRRARPADPARSSRTTSPTRARPWPRSRSWC